MHCVFKSNLLNLQSLQEPKGVLSTDNQTDFNLPEYGKLTECRRT